MAVKEHNVPFAKVREERRDEVETWKATTSLSEATLAKLREETSVTVSKLRSERDNAAASHHELLSSFHRVVKAHKERKGKVAETLVKLHKVYDDDCKVPVEAQGVE